MQKTRKIGRNAISGQIVSLKYVETNPDTTVIETVKVGRAKKGKCKK